MPTKQQAVPMRTRIAGFCLTLSALTIMPSVAHGQINLEQKVLQMEAQIAELKKLIAQQSAVTEKKIEKVAQIHKVAPAPTSGGTTFKYGGFIKVNGMIDDYKDGPAPTASVASRILVPSLIPVGNGVSEDAEFNSDVATSRFFFKTSTDTDYGKVSSNIELDFLSGGGDERVSNSTNSRIRHAYLSWDYAEDASLLVGQTWSTFFNCLLYTSPSPRDRG